MAEYILNTGWKQWDKYLSKYVDKKINCLDIGANNGKYTKWLLENLSTNNYSRIFSVDKWDPIIEKEFDTTISKTIHKDRNIKMNMKIAKALLKLKEVKYILFDVIIIGGTLDARKILINTILSWDILAEGGIILFSDYNIGELYEDDLKIKLAIDSFVSIFKPQIKLLYVGYEYIIEKINERKIDHPELEDYYRLLDEINYLKIDDFKVKFDDEMIDDLDFKLELSTKLIDEQNIVPDIIPNIKNQHLFPSIFNVDNKYLNILKIIKEIDNPDLHNAINNIFTCINVKNNYIFNTISLHFIINFLNKITSAKDIFIIDYRLDNNIYQHLYTFSKCKQKTNVTFNNIAIKNINIYNTIIDNNKKYDYMYFGFIKEFNYSHTEQAFVFVLYYIGIILNCQEIYGSSVIYIPQWTNKNLVYNIIYLLKKYYKNITLKNRIHTNIDTHYLLYCNNLINKINKIDINAINKFINNIYNDKIYYINTFLLIKNENKDFYNNFNIKINNFINTITNKSINIINFYTRIYTYITNYKIKNNKTIYNNILYTFIKLKINILYNYYIKYEYKFS
jgi:hypothetical protein